MKPNIIIIAALVIGISVISIGFLSNQGVENVVNTLSPYEKLEKYKEDLEKINQYNNAGYISFRTGQYSKLMIIHVVH